MFGRPQAGAAIAVLPDVGSTEIGSNVADFAFFDFVAGFVCSHAAAELVGALVTSCNAVDGISFTGALARLRFQPRSLAKRDQMFFLMTDMGEGPCQYQIYNSLQQRAPALPMLQSIRRQVVSVC